MKKLRHAIQKKYKNQAGINFLLIIIIIKPTSTKPQAGKLG